MSGGVVLTEAELDAINDAFVEANRQEFGEAENDAAIQHGIEDILTTRLAAQAGRVAETVEKVWLEHRFFPGACRCGLRISASTLASAHLTEAAVAKHYASMVAAELEADHG